MKKLLIVALLLCASSAIGQVGDGSIALVGPVLTEGKVSVSIGYAREIGSGFYLAGFGGFGETVEAEASAFKLFGVWKKLYVGPVLGGGVDWSDEIGTGGEPTTAELFGAAGAVATYTYGKVGLWGFWKRNIAERANDPTAGLGLYYQF